MLITFITISTVLLIGCIYFMGRAYILAGAVTDLLDYYDDAIEQNKFMYRQIKSSYDHMKQIDRLGAFEKDDEAGTTFNLLKETLENLKEIYDGSEEENQ
jgi:hypothetical protein